MRVKRRNDHLPIIAITAIRRRRLDPELSAARPSFDTTCAVRVHDDIPAFFVTAHRIVRLRLMPGTVQLRNYAGIAQWVHVPDLKRTHDVGQDLITRGALALGHPLTMCHTRST